MAATSADGTSVSLVLAAGPAGSIVNAVDGRVREAATLLAGSAPRTRFVAAMSSRAASVFIVGGADPLSGAQRGDAWEFHQGTWTQLAAMSLRRVLAAVARNADRALYLVDHDAGEARLIRVPFGPTSDEATVLVTWKMPVVPDALFLINTAASGELMIFGTSYRAGKFWGGTLNKSGGKAKLRNRFVAKGALLAAPAVSKFGVSAAVFREGEGIRNVLLPLPHPEDGEPEDDMEDFYP